MKLALAAAALALGGLFHGSATRVQVVAKEYSFGLSRLHVTAGTATFELANFGEDPHDLRIQKAGARHVAGTPVVAPGGRAELTVKLAPGRYSFWCSIANHRQLGMRATLVVTR
ncbi:MAG TPA: cupredoxin domain-containing protein [Gaiellaceae bacterium]|nr:cupredoxin domain-containing protein [Gaiellaceae bacterium]